MSVSWPRLLPRQLSLVAGPFFCDHVKHCSAFSSSPQNKMCLLPEVSKALRLAQACRINTDGCVLFLASRDSEGVKVRGA